MDGEQVSLFPSEAQQIQSIAEAESAEKAPFAFSVPQADVDQILRFGSNTENSRIRVAVEFMKQKSQEDIAVRGTHEAIISHELFDKVQSILDQTAEAAKKRQVKPYTLNPLKGKIFCAQCGKALHRQRNSRKEGDDVYLFHCLTPSRVAHDDALCKGVTIREDKLLSIIMDAMRKEMSAEMEASDLMQTTDKSAEKQLALSVEKKGHELEIQNLRCRIRGLYEDLVQGIIDKDDYFLFKSQYEEKIIVQEAKIAALEKAIKSVEQDTQRRHSLFKYADTLAQKPEMAQELIDRLVECAEVTHDKEVHVTFRFQGREE